MATPNSTASKQSDQEGGLVLASVRTDAYSSVARSDYLTGRYGTLDGIRGYPIGDSEISATDPPCAP